MWDVFISFVYMYAVILCVPVNTCCLSTLLVHIAQASSSTSIVWRLPPCPTRPRPSLWSRLHCLQASPGCSSRWWWSELWPWWRRRSACCWTRRQTRTSKHTNARRHASHRHCSLPTRPHATEDPQIYTHVYMYEV